MPRINLLPWREELRQKRKKEFLMALLATVMVAGLLVYVSKLTVQGWVDHQNRRNALLNAEIAELDSQIEEILGLEEQKNRLLARMDIIDQLQRSRPEVVHLFDEIVDALPEGVYLTGITQTSNRVELDGVAQSSTRVAALMRNIDGSDWLSTPQLGSVEVVGEGPGRSSVFKVTALQVPMSDDSQEAAQ